MNRNLEKYRASRADRCEMGEGKCNILGLASAAVGALGSIFAANQNRKAAEAAAKMEETTLPQLAEWQKPYVTGPGWQPNLPRLNPYAVNYAQGLSGGFNPSFGPAHAQGFGGLMNSLGYGQGTAKPTVLDRAWYQDPRSNPQTLTGGGGMAGLLGYGMGSPPPMLTSNPMYSGMNVVDPSLLMQTPGQDFSAAQQLMTPIAPRAPVPAPVIAPETQGEEERWRLRNLMNNYLSEG